MAESKTVDEKNITFKWLAGILFTIIAGLVGVLTSQIFSTADKQLHDLEKQLVEIKQQYKSLRDKMSTGLIIKLETRLDLLDKEREEQKKTLRFLERQVYTLMLKDRYKIHPPPRRKAKRTKKRKR